MSEATKVALVTGAGTGIGAGIALGLARAGYSTVLCGLVETELETTLADIAAISGECLILPGNIADPAFRAAFTQLALTTWGRIDVLVNNAGISGVAAGANSFEESIEHFETILAVNLNAAYFLAQLAGRAMRAQGGGSIINISSVAGQAAQIGGTGYCISKAGMDAMVRSLALEWASHGIRVNSIAPGDIRTVTSTDSTASRLDNGAARPFTRQTPLGRQGTPEDIAGMVNFLVSDSATFVTGETIRVDGGFLIY